MTTLNNTIPISRAGSGTRRLLPIGNSRGNRNSTFRIPHSAFPAFSLIEMMIAIVILGLGLVMTATMFPVAWTRARTLTEFTTHRAVTQSAAALLGESLRASGSTYVTYTQSGADKGKYFLSSGSLAGDLFYDPLLHNDPEANPNPVKLPCDTAAQCFEHLSILIPSDTRVHALHMENLSASSPTNPPVPERPFRIERMLELCDLSTTPLVCRTDYPISDYPVQCDNPVSDGADFCARSFYSPQVSLGSRLYPPIEAQPVNASDAVAQAAWLENFNTRRYAWAALHRLRDPVGPVNVPGPPDPLTRTRSRELAAQAARAAGSTRIFDFYVVTLKRAQPISRFAVQDPDTTPLIGTSELAAPAPLPEAQDVALPVAWRVQVEIPNNLRMSNGLEITPGNVPPAPDDDPTGIPTEIQVPPTGVTENAAMLISMFPRGTQFVDEISGQVLRVSSRRLNAAGTVAFLTLDRELYRDRFDDSPQFGGDGVLQNDEFIRTVWVFPPPIADRTSASEVTFDDATPVLGIDVKTISVSPPG